MTSVPSAIIVVVSEEHFTDADELCLQACLFVCARLEAHLASSGHTIPDWVRGGCEEDWGVYFTSRLGKERFDYQIGFFPDPESDAAERIYVQYHLKQGFLGSLFRKAPELPVDHPIHAVMAAFCRTFEADEVLTDEQFRARY